MAAVDNDFMTYCMPDFSLCGSAAGDLMPTAKEGWEYFTSCAWTDTTPSGQQTWKQDPFFCCCVNPPLLVGTWCVPCCLCAVNMRNAAKMTDKTCESNCLSSCVCGPCGLDFCYRAKKRTEFRKKYDLEGTPLCDCLLVCCTHCYICQDANQLMDIGGYNVPYCTLQNVDGHVAKEAKAKEVVKEEEVEDIKEDAAATPCP
jgi:Cys-rich protein (TIGR01571 family)